jgi:ketol-acid reductoisomerase
MDFGGVKEEVITREEMPLARAKAILKNEVVGILGYGPQGQGQGLNLKENGVKVIIGQRKGGRGWKDAVADGWIEGKNLFDKIEDVVDRSTIIEYLLSDAGQKEQWPAVASRLRKGQALCFSHGFSVVYREQTQVIPPADVDVVLVAPKGAGRTVRANFLAGSGINSSFAVHQDATGRARERVVALGMAIGSGYLFPTTFEMEVYSDLTGERGVLLGAIAGLMKAQYDTLRAMGHSPSEAFNETVEESTQSLYPLMGKNGVDWMIASCSTTAQRGALDWAKRFEAAVKPVMNDLYRSVRSGEETRRVLETCGAPDYRDRLEGELDEWRNSEMWKAGATVRALRPENWVKPKPKSKPGPKRKAAAKWGAKKQVKARAESTQSIGQAPGEVGRKAQVTPSPFGLPPPPHRSRIQRLEQLLREGLLEEIAIVEPVGLRARVNGLGAAPPVTPAGIQHQLEVAIQTLQRIHKLHGVLHVDIVVHGTVHKPEHAVVFVGVCHGRSLTVTVGILRG